MRQPIYIASSPAPISNNFARGSLVKCGFINVSDIVKGNEHGFLSLPLNVEAPKIPIDADPRKFA